MTDITIMGDSWACGEWDLTQTLVHRGTEQYLIDAGHKITNVAEGGASNRMQTSSAIDSKSDIILWFLTDPLRDLKRAGWEHQPRTLQSYHRRREQLLRTAFKKMNDLPVWLVGGACAIPDYVETEHQNWKVIVPDMRIWLIPDATPIDTLSRTWPYPDCSEELLTYHEKQEKMLARHFVRCENGVGTNEHKYFWPDGYHPNREAHSGLTKELLLPLL